MPTRQKGKPAARARKARLPQRRQSTDRRGRAASSCSARDGLPTWAYKLIEECEREDMQRAVLLARYTGQRQSDVLRMAPSDIKDSGIVVVQQKTGKELWVPLHPDLRDALEGWQGSPYVLDRKGNSYTPDRFRAAWAS
jgi:integrase